MRKPRAYGFHIAYARSKLANILFTLELKKRLAGTGIVVVSLHPGDINTNVWAGNAQSEPPLYRKVIKAIVGVFLLVRYQDNYA